MKNTHTFRFFSALLSLLIALPVFADLTMKQVQGQVENSKFKITFAKRKIRVGKHDLKVEIADSDIKRARGLMFRTKFEGIDGMLFIFEQPEPLSFWMKNTWMALSIGYFDRDGKLLNTVEMEPSKSETQAYYPSYPSAGSAKYALEMPPGWFEKNKIVVGTVLTLK